MRRNIIPKKEYEEMTRNKDQECCTDECCTEECHKKGLTILSIIAVSLVATSAMTWISIMNFKKKCNKGCCK